MKTREPDESTEKTEDSQSVGEIEAVEACVEDLQRAFAAKDSKAIAMAIKDIHDILHSYMDKDESFDAQNEKAAEGDEQ